MLLPLHPPCARTAGVTARESDIPGEAVLVYFAPLDNELTSGYVACMAQDIGLEMK